MGNPNRRLLYMPIPLWQSCARSHHSETGRLTISSKAFACLDQLFSIVAAVMAMPQKLVEIRVFGYRE